MKVVLNVLQHYDFKYKSSGILSNYNNFDKNLIYLIIIIKKNIK